MSEARLIRVAFKTSRLLDFVGRRELTAQIGHQPELWAIVILKEALDNSLDAAEEAEVAPEIIIEVSTKPGNALIRVTDYGPGIGAETIANILDYSTRTSSREAYCSPTRGSQGNALKTIIAMPYALSGASGESLIESRDIVHRIIFRADAVRQEPRIEHHREPADEIGKNGTSIEVRWPDTACHLLAAQKARFLQVCSAYCAINPHLSLIVQWDGEGLIHFRASEPDWPKWRASDPTSAHWYTLARLSRYMAAHLSRDEDQGRAPRTVREFIAEFRGLSGSAKQKAVLQESRLGRQPLAALFIDGIGDEPRIAALLGAMKRHTRPVKPVDLGVVGRDHLLRFCRASGGDPDSYRYRLIVGETHDAVPYVVEAGFAAVRDSDATRRMVLGVNFAAALGNPFRSFGRSGGYYDGLETRLAERRCGEDEPVVVVLHLACARVEYQDRGKTSLALYSAVSDAVSTAIDAVTRVWAKQRQIEERRVGAEQKRWARLTAQAEREREREERAKQQPERLEPAGVLGGKLASEAAAIGLRTGEDAGLAVRAAQTERKARAEMA
jgi:DNA topoisomerase VI subunit B